ncbi:MAG: hypothetical protein HY057_04995 [Rhodospirillales bacterium]|nr:hypothetical protein [Rhodospirillales bacterium]
MEELLGSTITEFILFTLVILGGAAAMTGQALAQTWREAWHAVPYGLLLAAANRFFSFALFGGQLLSLSGFIVDAIALIAIAVLAYRLTMVHKMVNQYPWLYERAGLFAWREKR